MKASFWGTFRTNSRELNFLRTKFFKTYFLELICRCLVAEPDNVLVGELNEWVANPLDQGQTSALQIKTRSA